MNIEEDLDEFNRAGFKIIKEKLQLEKQEIENKIYFFSTLDFVRNLEEETNKPQYRGTFLILEFLKEADMEKKIA